MIGTRIGPYEIYEGEPGRGRRARDLGSGQLPGFFNDHVANNRVEAYRVRMNRRDFLVTGVAAGSLTPLLSARASATAQQGSAPDKVKDVQVLVCDTFGTVVDWRSGVTAEDEELGRAKGLKVDWAAFADAWRAGYGPSMNRVRTGELPWTRLDDLHRMTLDGLLVEFKIDNLTEDDKKTFNRLFAESCG